MTSFTCATWNVNSLRVRLPHVLLWLTRFEPDFLALQETKLPDAYFPTKEFEEVGYHVVYSGQPTYNGVAILSRTALSEVITAIPTVNDSQRRFICATAQSIRICNVYVPNGESVESVKYQYKLNWLEQLNAFLQAELKQYPHLIILGDFNIAPDEEDVYKPAQCKGHLLFSESERIAFASLLKLGFADCFRLHPQEPNSFSWWDYRLNAFKRNMGFRIDHILASPVLASHCMKCVIDRQPRDWERPSDHAPVVAQFSF